MLTDTRTNMKKLLVDFRNFAKTPNNVQRKKRRDSLRPKVRKNRQSTNILTTKTNARKKPITKMNHIP